MSATARALALLAVVSGMLGGCASPQGGSAPELTGVSGVAAFLDGYLRAIEGRDEVSIRNSYDASGRFAWLEDGKLRYRSVDEVLAGLRSIPAGTPIRTTLTNLVVVPLGGNGAHARASFATTIGTGPTAFSFGGAITFALERQHGTWRIVVGHTSSPARR